MTSITITLFIGIVLALVCGWHRRAPDFIIGDSYLLRWWVIPRNPFFNIYLHRIGRNDDDRALHDHPWWNISIVLKGAYREHMPDGTRVLKRGAWALRGATALHRLEVVKGPVWTLFITGRRVREWGFQCTKGWVHWKDFTTVDGRNVGKGCGE